LPLGSHCVSFHASQEEAAEHAVDFVTTAPSGQAASYWVKDATLQSYYQEKLAEESPDQIGCVQVLDHEQVHSVEGRLRPVGEVLQFLREHPEGVTAAGETLTEYWRPENVPDHLEYEAWFQQQPREGSRFLCPYDLRKIPPESAPSVIRELAAHHSHVLLSSSDEPAVRLLQLFIFASPDDLPTELMSTLRWAIGERLMEAPGLRQPMVLTEAGASVVRAWSASATLDW
jgi:hypothetical protein